MKRFYEVTCCSSGFHYWQFDTRKLADIKQNELLDNGSHINVTIYETTRRAVSMRQPRKDAGKFCVIPLGLPCIHDHDHAEEKHE